MNPKSTARLAIGAAAGTEEEDGPSMRAIGAWVQQFARTLKNCRLYEPNNPAALRFRQQLVAALHQLIRQYGSFSLRFGAHDVTCEGVSLYPARSREDNLALPFYRDGIRALSFSDGVEPREIDALVSALLRVTGPETPAGEEDLVTLLWESQLPHIIVDYIPPEGDVVGNGGERDGELVPWPVGAAVESEPMPAEDPASRTLTDPPPSETDSRRSDDWNLGEATADFEAAYGELNLMAPNEVARFKQEYEAERAVPPVVAAVAVARAFLASEALEADMPDVAAYLPRVLRMAILAGEWREAEAAVGLMRKAPQGWSPVASAHELQEPSTLAVVRDHLLRQSKAEAELFTAFSANLAEFQFDVLGQLVAELGGAPQSKPLIDALVAQCRTTPERLAPWIADRRPKVVRLAVQMLGAIGGNAIIGPLQSAIKHPDLNVRADVIQALRTADARLVKPLYLSALPILDTRLFCQALQKLSETRDVQVAQTMLLLMIAPEFEARPAEEKHAIYSTLGATGGDEVIPELEAELLKGGWFERVNEAHRQTVARCLARIGTPMARMVLESGARSHRAQIRDACGDVIAKWEATRG